MRDVTLVTPTADQPTGMALCEQYMAAQTAWDRVAQWIVVDDGDEAAQLTMGQLHIRRERESECTGAESFCRNLLAALPHLDTEYVVVAEHDDLYFSRHLETVLSHLEQPGALIAGDDLQRYYHVGLRLYRTFDNWGASLSQTGFRSAALSQFEKAVTGCLASGWRGVDATFWREIPEEHWSIYRAEQVVGIKGLPGRPGIGIGHRPLEPNGWRWYDDPKGMVLRAWCKGHAETYLAHGEQNERASA